MAISIITTSLPNGTVGVAYSQTVQTTGGTAPLTFSVSAGTLPAGLSLNTSTGAITGTPTTGAVYNFSIHVVDNVSSAATQAYSNVRVFAPLNTAPDPGAGETAVFVDAGSQIQFTSTGGSGNYQWSVDGGNLINPSSGLLTAINGGAYTVTLVDTTSGQVATVNIVVTSQSQFCVQGVSAAAANVISDDPCCEFNVECGDRLQLRVPSFHVIEEGQRNVVSYSNANSAVTGEASALRSTAAGAGATGNSISPTRDGFFEIITSFDMAQVANGAFGIGFSSQNIDDAVNSIDHAVVWFTDAGVRKVEIRHTGVAEAASDFEIAQGDAVSFGIFGGELQLWINSVPVFTSAETITACGDVFLDIAIADADKTIGGYVSNLVWSIVTAGTGNEVGSIDANGIYTSPINPIGGVVRVLGTLNNANFYVNVRTIQPTPKFTKPQAFLAGRRAQIWVSNRKPTDNDIIRIASDGSPDAIQNPGMIYLGVLEGSSTFAEDNQTQDFTNDEGIYQTVITEERATLAGTFLEVRDLDKLAVMMQHATLHPRVKGVTEFSVGGKLCGGCDLRAVLVVEAGACGSGWDVIYLPRVQNIGNLSLEIGKKANTKYALNFRVLPDATRPLGKQLYSIYQMQNCTDVDNAQTCD
jgi:hypothetical protein